MFLQKSDAMCLLPLNIVNEKIFLVLWALFIILVMITITPIIDIITIIVPIIIITTRPKPPFGRQGLAGSWGKDKVRRVNFGVFSTSHFAHSALSSD